MRSSCALIAGVCVCVWSASVSLAAPVLVVDLSPDTTGASVNTPNWTNSVGQGQFMGEQFTLATGAVISGGSIYGDPFNGPIGTQVRFWIFPALNTPAVIDVITTIDAFDTVGTTSQSGLRRKHASITPTFLPAGTYFFAMPSAASANFTQGTGNFGDGQVGFAQGLGLSQLTELRALGSGFIQLEAVPEPATLTALASGGAMLSRHVRRRRQGSRIAHV